MKPELIELVKSLREARNTQDNFIDSLPSSINEAFFDNGMVNSLYSTQSKLLKIVFGELYEEISWFLWEFKDGAKMWEADGTERIFATEDDYYKYLETL